jgi:hypothetical protein
MRLEIGYISRHVDGKDFEPDDEALIFIEGVESDPDGNNAIHIQCADAKKIAMRIISDVNAAEKNRDEVSDFINAK